MKLTEFIKKLQEFKEQIESNCSHRAELWDKIEFGIKTKDDYEILDDYEIGYEIDLLPGCHCQSTLTLVFSREKEQKETNNV